jgi:hypothetical protein
MVVRLKKSLGGTMNRFGIFRISSVALLSIGFAVVNFSTALPLQAATAEECTKELLLSFFPEAFVAETLQKYQVSKDKIEPIINGLKEKNNDVIKLVDEQASKMDPNPLKDPSQKQVAVKIFRESLYQVFSSVLKANGVTDDQRIQAMLGEIQQLKTKRFAQCMDSNKPATEAPAKVAENDPKAAPKDKKDSNKKDADDDYDDDDSDDGKVASSDLDDTDEDGSDHY